jgi:hypothetical protein
MSNSISLKDLKLSELRIAFPGIVTNSKDKFLSILVTSSKIGVNQESISFEDHPDLAAHFLNEQTGVPDITDTVEHPMAPVMKTISNAVEVAKGLAEDAIMAVESIAEARHKMQITDNIPKYVLAHLYILQGCECTADAYVTFRDTNFRMSRQFQLALIKWYKELFKENIRSTSCSTCWARRITRFRKHLATKIDG